MICEGGKKHFLVFFLSCFAYGFSQPLEYREPFHSLAREGIDALYNGDFSKSHAIFSRLVEQYPSSPTPYLLLASETWWKIYLDPTNTAYDEALKQYIDKALALIQSYEENHSSLPENYELGKFLGYALKARLLAWRRSYFLASRYAMKCLPVVKENKTFQDFRYESYLGKGLYAYYREWYEERHPSLRWILALFPEGNKKEGIMLLQQCANQPNYMQVEAMVFLSEIFLFDERNYSEAYKMTKNLILRYPQNPLFQYLHALSCYHTHRSMEALTILNRALESYPYSPYLQSPIRVTQSLYTSYLMARIYTLCVRLYTDAFPNEQLADDFLKKAEKTYSLLSFLPSNEYGYFLFYKGLLLRKQGKCSESVSCFQQALDYYLSPDYRKRCEKFLEDGC